MLHITNGDVVVQGLVDGAIPGTHVAWRDPLHDGPVPQTTSLAALSDIRARALADLGAGPHDDIRRSFIERDRALAASLDHDEIVLWFEHDLYDQLQLLQVLDWFSAQERRASRLSIVQVGAHQDVPTFHGLGQLSGAQLVELFPARTRVTAQQLQIGRSTWGAVRASSPAALMTLAGTAMTDMPFLGAALRRFLQEYPSVHNGLSRTEEQLLRAGAAGARHRLEFYAESQRDEDCPWGDWSIFWRLDRLATGPEPALRRVAADAFALTDDGQRLLAREKDWLGRPGGIDAWIGGVHVEGPDGAWRWSETDRTLVSR